VNRRSKRVLHIVRVMDRGGVENWLMNVLRCVDRRRVQMDFLVHTAAAGAHDPEIAGLGAGLFRCTSPLWSPAYALEVARVLSRSGTYDVVHSHVHHFSGYVQALARRCGVRFRIAHSHSDTAALDRNCNAARGGYLRLMHNLVRRHATRLVAVSARAANALFGPGWASDPRSLVLPCGIDLAPFRQVPANPIRRDWRIGEDDLVVGHVGRFDTPKNHAFLVEIFREILHLQPQARLLLVGDGPLLPAIQDRVRELGISERTIFAGSCDRVAALLAAIDVFVFPSLYEGLPLSIVEAQAAGVPCVLSDGIAAESDVVPPLVHRISLSEPPARWASAALAASWGAAPSRVEALSLVEKSSFNVKNSMEQLYALYDA
jgi:glycosyltransferase involved in cell wall biosynthesis